MNKYFNLYEIKKTGLINGINKKCFCGEETTENICPKCGANLKKNMLLNVSKNTALAKREEKSKNGNILTYKNIHLFSAGFKLYEQTMLEVTIDLEKEEFRISNMAMFKKQTEGKGVFAFLDEYLPEYTTMVQECIDSAKNTVFTRITSLTEAYLNNILHIYLNYKALFPYMLKYKILYYGNLVNIKKYYPEIDFNNSEGIKEIDLNLHLLYFWDIKNTKYIETIIEISKNKEIQEDLTDMLIECKREISSLLRSWHFDGNNALDTFALLFNKEISVNDFIRIFKRSIPEYFFQLKKYRIQYKKIYKKEIDWSKLKGITRKDICTIETKIMMKESKKTTEEIENFFKALEENPLEALKII